ncbi:LysM peptidoglycan-binding domain-containing protein [Limisphaera sp. VF-2]|uniref:LysM peptidoglycan-binding domain-containing protein n=1 Tax=Limisphaera sp. VF-2 TaxID=3400418 RepID=UPI003C257611
MKARTWMLGCAALVWAAAVWAQDPALEERLNRMEGNIRDLLAAQAETQKRIATLVQELDQLREQIRSNHGDWATQSDVRRLTAALEEVDRKRREDYEKIHQELRNLAKVLASPAPTPRPATPTPAERETRRRPTPSTGAGEAGGGVETGYEYVVKPGDTLSAIVQAYREQGVNVTVTQVLKANPGLNPNRLLVGQKIFIPAPQEQ